MIRLAPFVALTLLVGSAAAPAQEPDKAASLAALREGASTYARAFEAGDADALAAMFAPAARLIGPDGEIVSGREAIRDLLRESFQAEPGRKLAVTLDEVHLAGPTVAISNGRTTMTAADGSKETTAVEVIHTRDDQGRWSLAEVRESAPLAEPVDHLADLAWLLGDWINEGPDSVIHYQGSWDDPERRSFLIRKFKVVVGGQTVLTGTHRIGFDAERGRFRGWIFDSEGGFADEEWFAERPGVWLIQTTGVDAEGARAGSIHRLSRRGDEAATLEILGRTHGGEASPAAETHALVRPPASTPATP